MADTQRAGDHANQQQYRAEIQNFYDTHVHQIDGEDAKEYLLTLFRDNFPALRADAMKAAAACAEDMAIEIVVELVKDDPALLSNLRKPRVQAAIISAQQSYAETADPDTKTGDIPLGRVLARLVSTLAKQKLRGRADIVLRQAVEIAPRLTQRQMNALSVVLILSSMRWTIEDANDLVDSMHSTFERYYGQIPTTHLDYSYLSSLGVGTYLLGPEVYDQPLKRYPNEFRKQLSWGDLPAELNEDQRDLIFELVPGKEDIWRVREDASSRIGNEPTKNYSARQLLRKATASGYLSSDEFKDLVHSRHPDLGTFLDQLHSTHALYLTLNLIGWLLAKEELSIRFPGAQFIESFATDLESQLVEE